MRRLAVLAVVLATGCGVTMRVQTGEVREEIAIDSAARMAAFEELEAMRPAKPPKTAGACEWQFAGPTNIYGRVTGIAVDPVNGDRLFISTVGGLWRSLDGARNWQRVSDSLIATVWGSVAINPADSREVFAGGGDPNIRTAMKPRGPGIFRTFDDGATWTKVSPPELDLSIVYKLRITRDGTVYAATDKGVWIGTRAGPSISFAPLGDLKVVNDVVINDSVTPNVVYAGAQGTGVFRWDGMAWVPSDRGIGTDRGVITLAIARSAPSTLFAKVTKASGDKLLGVYKSADGGKTWTKTTFTVSDDYSYWNALIEVDPTNANNVYAGSIYLWGSSDGGASWDTISGAPGLLTLHVDQHALAFDPRSATTLYVGNDGGVARSTGPPAPNREWIATSAGLSITQFYTVATQAMPTLLAGGSQDNGWEITFGNRTWYSPIGGDGHYLAVDGVNPDVIYGSFKSTSFEYSNPIDGVPGYPGQIVTTGVTPAGPYATDATLRAAAIAQSKSTSPMRLVKTINGIKFDAMRDIPASLTAIAIAPGSSFKTYYAGLASGVILRTTDGGTNWIDPASGLPGTEPTSIAVDAADAKRAFATFEGGASIYATSDGGANWTPIGSGLPSAAELTGVVIDPSDSSILYVGSRVGPFRGKFAAGKVEWEPFDEGLPRGADIQTISVRDSTLTVATFGNGAYQRELRDTCEDALLTVRDNVFDRGQMPSPTDIPDPEYPTPIGTTPFYGPDDSRAGRVYWWASTDIRIDVPSTAPPANQVADVNQPSFESCAPRVARCPAGTILDAQPVPGAAARVFVQATNYGRKRIKSVRVMTLWTSGELVPRLLPVDFWTNTFRADGTCGPIAPGPWKTLGCRTIDVIDPALPAIAQFDWNVPADVKGPFAFLAIIDSPRDPLEPWVRALNVREIWRLAPDERHVAYRNMQVVDVPPARGIQRFRESLRVDADIELTHSSVFSHASRPQIETHRDGVEIVGSVSVPGRLTILAERQGRIVGGVQWLIRERP